MDVVVNPPKPGEPSYESFTAQKNGVLNSLAEKAQLVADTFNSMEGFTCCVVQGAMYAFPRYDMFFLNILISRTFYLIRIELFWFHEMILYLN